MYVNSPSRSAISTYNKTHLTEICNSTILELVPYTVPTIRICPGSARLITPATSLHIENLHVRWAFATTGEIQTLYAGVETPRNSDGTINEGLSKGLQQAFCNALSERLPDFPKRSEFSTDREFRDKALKYCESMLNEIAFAMSYNQYAILHGSPYCLTVHKMTRTGAVFTDRTVVRPSKGGETTVSTHCQFRRLLDQRIPHAQSQSNEGYQACQRVPSLRLLLMPIPSFYYSHATIANNFPSDPSRCTPTQLAAAVQLFVPHFWGTGRSAFQ